MMPTSCTSCELLDLIKARQYNEPERLLLRWDSNPRHTAYEADALPTQLAGPNQGNTRQGQPV